MTFEIYDDRKKFYSLIQCIIYTFRALFDFTPNLSPEVIWLFRTLLLVMHILSDDKKLK